MTNNEYLASKPRYEIPDGLRGVAADFFFLLSGFVIGYAYDDRWDKRCCHCNGICMPETL